VGLPLEILLRYIDLYDYYFVVTANNAVDSTVCEIWTLKQKCVRRLRTAEMTFMILYHRRNEGILETEVNPVRKKLAQCKQNW